MKIFDSYQKQNNEEVFQLEDANGFSVVRPYSNTKYSKYVLFIRVFLGEDNFLSGNTEMSILDTEHGRKIFRHLAEEEIPKTVTNFHFSKEFKYDGNFFYNINYPKKLLTINQVIENLSYNHLRATGRIKKALHKMFYITIIYFSYFMVDKHYSREKAINEMVDRWIDMGKKQDKIYTIEISKPEPFLKYFNIYKNQLFLFLLFTGIVLVYLIYCRKGGFNFNNFPDITNSIVVIFSFLSLFALEKTSQYFNELFTATKNNRSKIDEWMHKIDSFSLKLKIK